MGFGSSKPAAYKWKCKYCGNENAMRTQTCERSSCKRRCSDRDFAAHMAAANEAEMRARWG